MAYGEANDGHSGCFGLLPGQSGRDACSVRQPAIDRPPPPVRSGVPYNEVAASGCRGFKESTMQGILRLVIILAFLAILVSLGTALYHLARGPGKGDSRKMVRALTVRIVLSILLFVLIMAAWWAGLIAPHGLQPR